MFITPLFGAVLALLYIYLSLGVSRIRIGQRISMGTGESNALDRAIRAHGNFSEYVPLSLILLWFVETLTMSRFLILILGSALVLARVMHAVGMLYPKKWLILRQFGIMLNYAVITMLSLYLIYWYFPVAIQLRSVLVVVNKCTYKKRSNSPIQEKQNAMSSRHNARKAAIQALYQWDLTGQEANEIEASFVQIHDMQNVDKRYLRMILADVPANAEALKVMVEPFIERPFSTLDPIEKAILRLGAYELRFLKDVPTNVILNEMIELAKVFGSERSYKFVNSVLDKLAKAERSA